MYKPVPGNQSGRNSQISLAETQTSRDKKLMPLKGAASKSVPRARLPQSFREAKQAFIPENKFPF